MRGRDAGALVTGRPDCRKGPCRKASGPQKRAARESLRTAEKGRAGKPPDRRKEPRGKASGPQKRAARESLRTAEKGRAGKPPDRRKEPRGKASGPQKRALNRGSGRRPPRHSQRCPTAGCGGTEKGPKRSAIRFSNPEIPHHRKTGAIRRSGLPGYFRSAFGCNSAPRTAAYKCDATPFHPTRRTLHTPLLFSTSVHPFQRRAVRPRRIASDRSHCIPPACAAKP